jgi:hypothetical protein
VEHLERVHKGIGEMQTLAANVGDLKNVLSGSRGGHGNRSRNRLDGRRRRRSGRSSRRRIVEVGYRAQYFAPSPRTTPSFSKS